MVSVTVLLRPRENCDAMSNEYVCLSACLSTSIFWLYYYGTLIGNPLPEVKPTGQRGRMATGSRL